MSQPAQGGGDRTAMPLTAEWIAKQRIRFGAKHVNDCLRRAIEGERNLFYAVENGRFSGTPFDWGDKGAYIVSMSVLCGSPFIAAIADPAGKVDMVITQTKAVHTCAPGVGA